MSQIVRVEMVSVLALYHFLFFKRPFDFLGGTFARAEGIPENYIKQRRDTFVFYALILLALVESKKMRLNQNKLSL